MRNKSKRLYFVLGLVALVAAVAIAVPTSQARKVGNAGNVAFNFTGGQLKVGSNTFDAGSPDEPITFQGTVGTNGDVNVPQSNIVFPPIDPIDGPLGTINVTVLPNGPATGNINPLTGLSTLNVDIRIVLSGGGVGSNCRIDPISLHLSSTSLGGSPYNTANGAVTLADRTFSVPGAQDCGVFGSLNGTVNSQAGIPSGSGNNFAVLSATTTPIIQKGIRAELAATPDSGLEPLNTTLSAASSFAPAGVKPNGYEWDFDGNGTFDQTTSTSSVAHTYSTPGIYNARVRVTDNDNDADIATKQITVQARVPDLTIEKSHTDVFVTGQEADFKITVKSVGTEAGNGPITVTDTLDPRFTYVSGTGSGWDCSATAGQNVSCTNPAGYSEAETLPLLTVRVATAGGTAGQTIPNEAKVANADDGVAGNNTSTDSVVVNSAGIDLSMDKETDGPSFLRGKRGSYILNIKNEGTLATAGDIVVTDALPAGTSLVSAFGPGFDCEASTSSNVSCELRAPAKLSPGEATTVRVRVNVDNSAPDPLVNTASVTTSGDTVADNDSDSESTQVRNSGVDLTVDKTHANPVFEREQTDTYRIVVKNQGTLGTAGPIKVTDTLPVGLEFVSATGGNWTCSGSASNPLVTCTRTASLQADTTAPAITLRVSIKDDAPASVTNDVSVTNEPISDPDHVDLDTANNSDSDQTDVRSLVNDLSIDKTHTGNFTAGKPAVFTLKVKNNGSDRTTDPITVTDNVPAHFVVGSVTGTGWSCNTGQSITCTRSAELGPGASAPDITIGGVPTRFAPPSISNTASVASHNNTNPANDSDTDVANVSLPGANTQPVTSIQGSVTFPSIVSGNATFAISVTRGLLNIYSGTVRIIDPGANHNITGQIGIFNAVGRTGLNGATGNATLANGQKILWSVDDLSALNLGNDEVYATAPSGYNTVTARVATAGNITVLPAP